MMGNIQGTRLLVDPAPLVEVVEAADTPDEGAGDTRTPPKPVSQLGMTINLVTGGLGSGILTLAWGMAGASVIVALILMLFVVALNCFTIMLLVHAAEKHKKFDLGALLRELPGQWRGYRLGPIAQGVCNALVWVTMWMTLVGYVIIVQDNLTHLFPDGSALKQRWLWAVVASAIVLPLSLMDLQFLSVTSSPLSVGVNIYLLGLLIYRLADEGIAGDDLPSGGPEDRPCIIGASSTGIWAFLSLMSNTIIIQMCILPMYEQLEDRTPRRFSRALGASFSLLFVLYATFATVAYLHFGPTVPANVLNDLAEGGAGSAARVGMSVVVLCVYPIMVVPMLAPVEGAIAASARPQLYMRAAAAGIVVSVMAMAFGVSDLGLMNVIAGALSVGGFVALAPGLAGLWLSHGPGSRVGLCWRVAMHLLIWGGLAVAILGFFFTDNYTDELARACELTA